MSTSPKNRQFSLRALLWLTLVVATFLAAWRAFGVMAWWGLPVAVLVVLALARPCRSWRWAWVLASSAVYGPFAAMGVYTLLFVSCSHCKAAVWTIFPTAPGIIPVELARRWLDLSRPPDAIWFLTGIACSAALLATLAWLVRRDNRWLRAVSVAVVLAYGTFAAIAILAVIRA
jgi:hypothetical protein